MKQLTKSQLSFFLCLYLSFYISLGASAQHTTKAILQSATTAGLLHGSKANTEKTLQTLLWAFDPGSPLDSLHKFVALAQNAQVDSNGRGTITVEQLCTFYDSMNTDFNMLRNADWQNFRKQHGPFISHMLYKKGVCGAGFLNSIEVLDSPTDNGRYVTLKLKQPLNFTGPAGSYTSENSDIKYFINSDVHDAERTFSKFQSTKGSNFNNTLWRSWNLAPEVGSALDLVKAAAQNKDPSSSARALAYYDLINIRPATQNDFVTFYKNDGSSAQLSEISLMAPKGLPLGNSSHTRRGVIVVSSHYDDLSGTQNFKGSLGNIEVPTSANIPTEWKPVVTGTLSSVNDMMTAHFRSIEKSGVGTMFGNNSFFAKMTPAQREAHLMKATAEHQKNFPGKPLAAYTDPVETSCIGFVMKNLKAGYMKAAESDPSKAARWREIEKIVADSGGQGTYLLRELHKDGWTTVYWNPDVIRPAETPQASKDAAHHIWTASEVKKGKPYLSGVKSYGKVFDGIPIDEQMLNYRPTPLSESERLAGKKETSANLGTLEAFKKVPFFVGIANGGYHVYMGSQGSVIESHSSRNPDDQTNIEIRPFSEWGMLPKEGFQSGVIAVPPDTWFKTSDISVPRAVPVNE